MARDNYPTGNDVEAFLTQAKLTTTGLDLNAAAEAGRNAFEALTGRQFLAVSATREYDPPVSASGILDLGADLVSLSAITYGGTTQVAGTDYRLVTPGQPGAPYTMLRFARRWASPLPWSQQGSLALTGLWGYAVKIPEDAWQAMRAASALFLLPAISYGLGKGIVSWSDEDTSEKYAEDRLGALAEGWGMVRDGAVVRYRRVAVG